LPFAAIRTFEGQRVFMEFGKVEQATLDTIEFALPPEPGFNTRILSGKAALHPRVYVGCAKWGREDWVGKIYPWKTRERDYLQNYVRHYNSIELNATHYKIYGEPGIRRWADKAKGKDFLFCPKLYQGITHKGKLDPRHPLFNEFFRGMSGFGEHLGPVFIQFNDRFSPRRSDELFNFLAALPKGFIFFLEVRHPGWFTGAASEKLFSFLESRGIGAVITDTAGRRDALHLYLTIPKTFIRFVGNSLHPSDYRRIDSWVEQIKNWLSRGLEELYFFVHMHDEVTSPELSLYLVEQLNKHCGLSLSKPTFILPGTAKPAKSKPKRQWPTL
jgi:uncharacterized protein YecE (DUF72 family)